MVSEGKLNLKRLTYTGSITLDRDTQVSTLPGHLAECLRSVQAGHVIVDGNRITYRNDLCRVAGRWNIVGPFGSGELQVDSSTRQVRYRLSIAPMIVSSILLFGLVGILTLPGSYSRVGAVLFLILTWIFVIGGNLLIGMPRFRAFLSRSISNAPRTPLGRSQVKGQ